MVKKTYASKWILIGVSQEDRIKIYQRLRLMAKERLRQVHKEEYKIILKRLINQEYLRLKKLKGGI